jgi:hypothetical protein
VGGRGAQRRSGRALRYCSSESPGKFAEMSRDVPFADRTKRTRSRDCGRLR